MKAERCVLWWDKSSRCVCDTAAVTWRSRLVTWISLKLCWLAHQNSSHSQVTIPAISSTRWRVHKSAELARNAMRALWWFAITYKSCRNLAARGATNALPGSGCYFCSSSSESSARSWISNLRSKVCKIASRSILIGANWQVFFLGMQIRSPQWRCLIRVPVRRCYRVSNISTWRMHSTSDLTNLNV